MLDIWTSQWLNGSVCVVFLYLRLNKLSNDCHFHYFCLMLSHRYSSQIPGTCPENSLQVDVCTEGTSLVRLIRGAVSPSQNGGNVPWKDAAYSQFPRHNNNVMGYTVRTDTHRYTEWVNYDKVAFTPDWTQVVARELYEHASDPDENHNMADDPSQASIVQQLSQKLKSGWRATLDTVLTLWFIQMISFVLVFNGCWKINFQFCDT